jgi:hypothetical protein
VDLARFSARSVPAVAYDRRPRSPTWRRRGRGGRNGYKVGVAGPGVALASGSGLSRERAVRSQTVQELGNRRRGCQYWVKSPCKAYPW